MALGYIPAFARACPHESPVLTEVGRGRWMTVERKFYAVRASAKTLENTKMLKIFLLFSAYKDANNG